GSPEAGPGSLGSLALLGETGIVPEGPLRTAVDLLSGLTPGTGSIIDGMNETVPNPVTPVPTEERRATRVAPDGPVVGGTAYEVPVDGGILECSTGFNGDDDGRAVELTVESGGALEDPA